MIASALAYNGNFHVFKAEGKKVSYTYQRKGENAWAGGEAGKGPAAFGQFATADSEIVGISATLSAGGNLHVLIDCENGKSYYTWQRKNESAWEGGEKGKTVAGLTLFAP